jgi:hypothetical protein
VKKIGFLLIFSLAVADDATAALYNTSSPFGRNDKAAQSQLGGWVARVEGAIGMGVMDLFDQIMRGEKKLQGKAFLGWSSGANATHDAIKKMADVYSALLNMNKMSDLKRYLSAVESAGTALFDHAKEILAPVSGSPSPDMLIVRDAIVRAVDALSSRGNSVRFANKDPDLARFFQRVEMRLLTHDLQKMVQDRQRQRRSNLKREIQKKAQSRAPIVTRRRT